jgi:hypothetical protein
VKAISQDLTIHVESVATTTEIEELAKAAGKFGMRFVLWPVKPDEHGHRVYFVRDELVEPSECELIDDLTRLVYLEAITSQRSARDVLAAIVEKLEEWRAQGLDVPPSDAPGIGSTG